MPLPRRQAIALAGGLGLVLLWAFHELQALRSVLSYIGQPPFLRLADAGPPYLVGPPTASFRDNLRNDTRYISTWPVAGMTNGVMALMNLLYVAQLTDRVAILSPFSPLHVGRTEPFIPVSAVFDLPRFTAETGVRAVDWEDVKRIGLDVLVEELGCWTEDAVIFDQPVYSPAEAILGLDIAHTPVPQREEMVRSEWMSLMVLYALDFDLTRKMYLENYSKALIPNSAGKAPLPDTHLMCFDDPYYMGVALNWEFDFEWAPAWWFIGRHLHFNSRIKALASDALHLAFGIPDHEPLPPFVAIHIRHGDFIEHCGDGPPCFAPLADYARRVLEVQDELREKHGIVATYVVLTSDERDPEWWVEAAALGWARFAHGDRARDPELGNWLPFLVDSAAQSMAIGFVGTHKSTVTMMALRRVRTWNGGVVRKVNFGPGSDPDYYWTGSSPL